MQNNSSIELVKGINIIFITNIINLLLNAITNFILPKYLMLDVYAQIKEYQMYVSYVGLLHLGYTEGIYLKYGGKEYGKIDKQELKRQFVSLFGLQFAISLVVLLICCINKQLILMFAVISALPINMSGAYKLVYQATGEFKRYGFVMNLTSIITLFINVVLVFFLAIQNACIYICAYVVAYYIIWLLLERNNHFYRNIFSGISVKLIVGNIKNGFLLMLGNFASIIQTTMDRLFIKVLLTSSDFAYYSFAVSMESMLNVLISPLTVTMYNYFCRDIEKRTHKFLLRILLIASTFLISCAFILNFLVLKTLPHYVQAAKIIYFLFATQFLYVFVKGIYLNLYKANSNQKKYFIKLMIVLCIGFILNYVLYLIMKVKESFALATFVSAVIWYVFCVIDFPDIGMGKREHIFAMYEMILFFSIAYIVGNSFCIGFVLFIAFSFVGIWAILRIKIQDARVIVCKILNRQ